MQVDETSSGAVSGLLSGLGFLSLGGSGAGSELIDTTLGATAGITDDASLGVFLDVGQAGDDTSSNDSLSLDVSLPVTGQADANNSSDDAVSLDAILPITAQVGGSGSSGDEVSADSTDQLGPALIGATPPASGAVTGQESAAVVVVAAVSLAQQCFYSCL